MNAADDRAQPGPEFLRIDTREEFAAAVAATKQETRARAIAHAYTVARKMGLFDVESGAEFIASCIISHAFVFIDEQARLLADRHFGAVH